MGDWECANRRDPCALSVSSLFVLFVGWGVGCVPSCVCVLRSGGGGGLFIYWVLIIIYIVRVSMCRVSLM